MKHGNEFYLELPRTVCQKKYNTLSDAAFRLFVMLNEEEQRYIDERKNPDVEIFFRSDQSLAEDLGWSVRKLQRAKAELRQTNLLSVGTGHYYNPTTKKKSEKHYTSYEIF